MILHFGNYFCDFTTNCSFTTHKRSYWKTYMKLVPQNFVFIFGRVYVCTNEAFQVFGSRPLFCERTLLIGSSEAFQFVVELFCKCMYEKTFWMFLESVFWRVFTHLSLCTLFPPPPSPLFPPSPSPYLWPLLLLSPGQPA